MPSLPKKSLGYLNLQGDPHLPATGFSGLPLPEKRGIDLHGGHTHACAWILGRARLGSRRALVGLSFLVGWAPIGAHRNVKKGIGGCPP